MIKSILEDILFFVNNVEFSFVHRKDNVSAHLFAQWTALVNWFGPVLISNLPSHVSQAFVRQLEMGPGPIFLCLPYFGLSLLSNKVFIQKIYIYICVCVCVCLDVRRKDWNLSLVWVLKRMERKIIIIYLCTFKYMI